MDGSMDTMLATQCSKQAAYTSRSRRDSGIIATYSPHSEGHDGTDCGVIECLSRIPQPFLNPLDGFDAELKAFWSLPYPG